MGGVMDFIFQIRQILINSLGKFHSGLWVCLLYCNVTWGLSMPTNVSKTVGEQLISSFSFQNVGRMNGPANSIGIYPGIYPGVEFLLFYPPSLEDLGLVNNGQLPVFMPVPRLFLVKGLPYNVDFNFHFLPAFVMPAYHGWGGSLKWTVFPEKISFAAFAVKVSYDYARFIQNTLTTQHIAGDVIMSQDFVDFIPYGGVGLINATSALDPAHTSSGLADEYSQVGAHVFVGVQIKAPLTFSVETGFANKFAYVGMSVGKNLFDQTPADQM